MILITVVDKLKGVSGKVWGWRVAASHGVHGKSLSEVHPHRGWPQDAVGTGLQAERKSPAKAWCGDELGGFQGGSHQARSESCLSSDAQVSQLAGGSRCVGRQPLSQVSLALILTWTWWGRRELDEGRAHLQTSALNSTSPRKVESNH